MRRRFVPFNAKENQEGWNDKRRSGVVYGSTFLQSLATISYWDDLRFPATAVNPPGAASDPDWDTTIAGFLFDPAKQETIYVIAQMPHEWKEESTLKPHVHWQKTTSASGDVMWELEYRWAPINEVMDGSWTTLTSSSAVGGTPDTDTADKHLITSFGDLSAVGKALSDMLIMRFSRLGADAADTYGDDARMLEFDIHYEIDSFGSDNEFS